MKSNKQTITYKHIKGQYPIPMIMVWYDPNKDVFDEKYNYSYGEWTNKYKTIWFVNAYLIYDEKTGKVVAYKYNEFANIVWLLRMINIDLEINLDNSIKHSIEKYYLNEFIKIN